MPSFRRRASVIDADSVAEAPQPDAERSMDPAEALALAEAEAAEAEAAAAAARAKARAIRLRKQAEAAEAETEASESRAAAPIDDETDEVAAHPAEVASEDAGEVVSEDAGEVDASANPAAAPKRRRLRIPRLSWKVLGTVLAILCTLVLIGLSVLMVLNHRHQTQDRQRTAEYAAAARQTVVTLMSLDFNKAKEDVQRIIDNSAGQFKEDFQAQAEDFAKVAQESKVVTEVNVNAAAVQSMTDTTATALVSATSRVTNKTGANQQPRSWRLLVDLVREGDQIKMSKVEFVP